MENMKEIDEAVQRIIQKLCEKKITMNEPVSIDKINNFENTYGIILPEEFCKFYTEVGNGCNCMIDNNPLFKLDQIKSDIDEIKLVFPFKEYYIWEDDQEQDKEQMNQVWYGNIKIIDIGCGESWHLIVTGEERGQMWHFCEVGIQPCSPELSFLEWFEFWLDGNEDYFYGLTNQNSFDL